MTKSQALRALDKHLLYTISNRPEFVYVLPDAATHPIYYMQACEWAHAQDGFEVIVNELPERKAIALLANRQIKTPRS